MLKDSILLLGFAARLDNSIVTLPTARDLMYATTTALTVSAIFNGNRLATGKRVDVFTWLHQLILWCVTTLVQVRLTLQEFGGCRRFDYNVIRVLHGAQRVEPICGSSSSLKLQLGLVHGEPVSAQLLGIVPNRVSLLVCRLSTAGSRSVQ